MGLGELLMYASCCLLVCLYVFDFSNWDGPGGRAMQRLCVCLVDSGSKTTANVTMWYFYMCGLLMMGAMPA